MRTSLLSSQRPSLARCATLILAAASLLACGGIGCAERGSATVELDQPDALPNRAVAEAAGSATPPGEGGSAGQRPEAPPEGVVASYTIELRTSDGDDPAAFFEVAGLAEGQLEQLATVDWQRADWTALFAVFVAGEGTSPDSQPAVLGSYQAHDTGLRFQPRFPVEPGVRYRAVFDPARLPRPSAVANKAPAVARKDLAVPTPVVAEFAIPAIAANEPARVEHVYPSADVLPENQLKFYLHFSAPMSRGEAYRRIHLLESSGEEVEYAFLELGEELWDPTGTRFTLFIDPGRIKQGLKPREELGPVLEQGNDYTLVIDADWRVVTGNPLAAPHRKRFRVDAPDEQPVDVALWKVTPPRAGSRDPLVVTFPEPLDHAMLERVLVVVDGTGHTVEGALRVDAGETRWSLVPAQPWQAARYEVVVATALEDLAGNSIGRPFEVDVFREIKTHVESETVSIPFDVIAEVAVPATAAPR
jgi:hypothetical protein